MDEPAAGEEGLAIGGVVRREVAQAPGGGLEPPEGRLGEGEAGLEADVGDGDLVDAPAEGARLEHLLDEAAHAAPDVALEGVGGGEGGVGLAQGLGLFKGGGVFLVAFEGAGLPGAAGDGGLVFLLGDAPGVVARAERFDDARHGGDVPHAVGVDGRAEAVGVDGAQGVAAHHQRLAHAGEANRRRIG